MSIHKLSTTAIERIVRQKRQGIYGDGGGLWLQVLRNGSVSWLFRYRYAGRARAAGLGPLHTVDRDHAREQARAMRLMVREGRDPIAERRGALSRALSFDAVFALLVKRSDKPLHGWQSMMARYASPVIGHVPIDRVSTDDVLRVIKPLWETTTYTASRLRSRIEHVLDFAAHGMEPPLRAKDAPNPARWQACSFHLEAPNKVTARKSLSAMPYADVPAFMAMLGARELQADTRALEFAILTLCRSGDIVGKPEQKRDGKIVKAAKAPLRWDDIDMTERVWWPSSVNPGRKHLFPVCLTDAAIAVLELVKGYNLDREIVFPIGKNAMLNVMCEVAPEFTVHGFRASFKTWTDEETSVHPDVAETCLSHRVSGGEVENMYRRGSLYWKRRELMTVWSDYVCGTATGKVTSLVLRKRDAVAGSVTPATPADQTASTRAQS